MRLSRDVSPERMERLRYMLSQLYGADSDRCLLRLKALVGRYGVGYTALGDPPPPVRDRWSEKDTILSTFADGVEQRGQSPMTSLGRFLVDRLLGSVGILHLLPFHPHCVGDPFSVEDHRDVAPQYGTWSAIHSIGRHFDLAFDIVLNHVSRRSRWFRDFVSGVAPARRYFLEMSEEADLSRVVRPCSRFPLLSPVRLRERNALVWTTFGPQRVDLDFSNADVLFEFLDILLLFISHGVRVVRLDWIGHIWKRAGTPCFELAETHVIAKLVREVLDMVAPAVVLVADTQSPVRATQAYLGDGEEAMAVPRAGLGSVVLMALLAEDATRLQDWVRSSPPLVPGTTYWNALGGARGLSLRAIRGEFSDGEVDDLIATLRERGAEICGFDSETEGHVPVEAHVSWFDALAAPSDRGSEEHIARIECSHLIALELQGIPSVYLPALTALPNATEELEKAGRPCAIQRGRWEECDLLRHLDDASSPTSRLFSRVVQALRVRREHAAFHPDGEQLVLDAGHELFALRREAPDGSEALLCLNNVTSRPRQVIVDDLPLPPAGSPGIVDLLRPDRPVGPERLVDLGPYESCWLRLG